MKINKNEKVSLMLVLVACACSTVTFLLERGAIRQWMALLSTFLVFLCMVPSFSSKDYAHQKFPHNRIALPLLVLFFSSGLLGMLAYVVITPFQGEVNTSYFFVTGLFGIAVYVLLTNYVLGPVAWLNWRMKWTTGGMFRQLVRCEKSNCGNVYSSEYRDGGTSFLYIPRLSEFSLCQIMYTNPARHEKEYEERKCRFQARMEQTRLPVGLMATDSDVCFGFVVRVMLPKAVATKQTVRRIYNIIQELRREDYDQKVYVCVAAEYATLYAESFHGKVSRFLLKDGDAPYTRYDQQEHEQADVADEPHAIFLASLLEFIWDYAPPRLNASNLIDAHEFEHLWEVATPE